MHPLLNLIATRPQLVAEHGQAYAELVAAEFPHAASVWKRQALLNGLALVGLLAALILGGTALMLWAALPTLPSHAPWLLIVVPLLPAAVALGCVMAARSGAERSAFADLRQQVDADLRMLRETVLAP